MVVNDGVSNEAYVIISFFISLIRMIIKNITSAEGLLESADLVYSRTIPNRWKFLNNLCVIILKEGSMHCWA